MSGARKRTRTSKAVRPLEPESSASASSAIRAHVESIIYRLLARNAFSEPNLGPISAFLSSFAAAKVALVRCVIAVENRARVVTTNSHRNILGSARTNHVPNCGSPEIVQEKLHTSSATHVIPRGPEIQHLVAVFPCEDQIIRGVFASASRAA